MKLIRTLMFAGSVLFATGAWSQGWEIVAAGGIATYSGDVGQDKTKFLGDHGKILGPSFGLGARYVISNRISVQLGFNYAKISGADSLASSEDRVERNLSFMSPITEGYVKGEFSLTNWEQARGNGGNTESSNLYLFVGMAFFKFDPQAYYNGQWVRLQPLGTEGQGTTGRGGKYALTSSAYLMGMGYRHRLGDRASLGIELGLRKTNTDYLDDVSTTYADNTEVSTANTELAAILADRNLDESGNRRREGAQRGNPKINDYYFLGQVTLAVKLGSGKSYGNSFGGGGKYRTRRRCFSF